MWQKIWHKLATTVAGGAIIIASASILSRLLGLIRDRLLASTFGAGDVLDTYYAAFKIPDFVFNVLVLGALSSAFIPVFVEYLQKGRDNGSTKEEAWHLANSMLNILLLGLLIVGGLFFIFAHQLVPLISPGFGPEKQAITIKLTRIMLLAIIFFGASNIVSGILNSFKRYLSFAFAPVMYNIGIIFGIFALVPHYGVYGLAYGVVLGALCHLLIQVPGVIKVGYRYRRVLDLKHEGVRKIARLMLPRAFGLAVSQIDQMVSVIIGSTLAVGSVAVFNLANNLQSFPINVFGVSLAIAAFPVFSEAFAQKDMSKFVVQFSTSFRRVLFLIIPASVLILLLRAQIVRVILGSGAFDWEDTYLTAQTLAFFSLSLFAQALIPMLARCFYAFQDTKTPVKVGILAVIIDIAGALTLTKIMEDPVTGLALAFSISSIVNMLLLLILVRKKVGYSDDKKIIQSFLKIVLASIVMGCIVWLAKYIIAQGVNMQTFIGIFIQGVLAGIIGIFAYLILAIILRMDEIKIITDWILKTKKQLADNDKNSSKFRA